MSFDLLETKGTDAVQEVRNTWQFFRDRRSEAAASRQRSIETSEPKSMHKPNDPALGEAIQNLVRRKWRYREHWTDDHAQELQLDDKITERIDHLGIDDKLLLEVEADRVIGKIEELERELAEEDLGGS